MCHEKLLKSENFDFEYSEVSLAFLQQVYGYMFLSKELGGKSLPKEYIQGLFNFNIKYITNKFGDDNLTAESRVLIQHRKALNHFDRQESTLTKSIQLLFGFGREITPVNRLVKNYIERSESKELDDDSVLIDILVDSDLNTSNIDGVLGRLLVKCLIIDRIKLKNKRKLYNDDCSDLLMSCGEYSTSTAHIKKMKEIVDDVIKFNVTSVQSMVDTSDEYDEIIVNGISSSVMKAVLRSSKNLKKKERYKQLSKFIDVEIDL